uniref:Ig-like domain-containing protein n=1 Tax=Erpetoichthys calabaricus TaxID=27687 RepID=A0A8C4T8P3_ERPCA
TVSLKLMTYLSDVNLADVFMQPHRSVRAQLGGSVILECHMPTPSTYTYIWIKLTPGKAPATIAFWSKLYNKDVAFKENGSVKYEVMKSSSSFNLLISHLDASALGTYYCGLCIFFGNETIRGIFQPPVLRPIQYGDDVTLECIINRGVFGDAHQVFWIHRTIRGSYQTIRSTHENKRTCESQECVYSLQKKNFSFQDMGTYYCALVTCGEVILGNGTEFTGKLTHNYRHHNHHVGKMLANGILYTLNLLIKQTPGSCIVFVFGKIAVLEINDFKYLKKMC